MKLNKKLLQDIGKHVINGTKPDSSLFDAVLKYCKEQVKLYPDLVIVFDIDTGFPCVVTKEQRDKFLANFDACKPSKISDINNLKGKIIYYGTKGDL